MCVCKCVYVCVWYQKAVERVVWRAVRKGGWGGMRVAWRGLSKAASDEERKGERGGRSVN